MHRRAAVGVFWLLAACGIGNQQTLKGKDLSVYFSANPFRLEVEGKGGKRLLAGSRLLATHDRPDSVSQILPGWDDYRANEAPWRTATRGRMVNVGRDYARAFFRLDEKSSEEPVSLDVSLAEDRVHILLRVSDERLNKLRLELFAGEDEHFFGLGERFASVDHRGLSLYSWAEEGGLGAGESATPPLGQFPYPNGASMTYFPVPFVHSTAGYSLFANTTRRTEMHMASEAPDRFAVAVNGRELPVVIYTRERPLDRLDDYTADTGRPMIPAPWVWGVRKRSSAFSVVFGIPEYQLLRQRNLPVTAFDDTVHFLPDNSQHGRETDLLWGTKTLHEWGYKVTAYNTPYVSASDLDARDDYLFGRDHGLFQLAPDGKPATTVFISGELHTLVTIDLLNPDGFTWYQTLLKRTLALGYDGWMNDFGEYTARDSVMFDGRTGEETHNLFPVLSAAAAHGLLEQERPNDYWFYVRSGYVGTQQYAPQVWGGDSEASFDDTQGLPSAVRGGINLGMVGVYQYGSDVTGFKCTTGDAHDKENFIRWLQFGAVSPQFHEENACANPLAKQSKWNLWNDEETQDAWRMTASFHTRLAPYLRTLALEANQTGTPIMRHPFLTHPEARDGWFVSDSYFFGPSLYAAPVVRRGITTRQVWLPPGRYIEWTERTVHSGPAFVEVPAPLMRLPLFLVENTLLPMLDAEVQTLAPATEPSVISEATRADVLDVIAALGPDGRAEMTLSDGTSIVLTRGGGGAGTFGTTVGATELQACASCSVVDDMSGQVSRARFNSAKTTTFDIAHGDLRAQVSGGTARRIRFEILRM